MSSGSVNGESRKKPGGSAFLVLGLAGMVVSWGVGAGGQTLVGAGAPPATPAAAAGVRPELPGYAAWREACSRLPTNRQLGDRVAPRERLPLRTFGEFTPVLESFFGLCRTGALAQASAWLDGAPSADTFFNLEAAYYLRPGTPFEPFAERYVVPPGTRLFFHGDLHGDIHSLLAYLDFLNREGHLEGFRVARPEVRLVFLGDYTDRGRHGLEVMYTLLRLKLASPDRVFLVRGNHEDVSLVARYGFLAEVAAKYGRESDIRRLVRLYDFLPAVFYLVGGTNVIQCNHGGVEPGYDPARLLSAPAGVSYQRLGRLEQRRLLSRNAEWVAGLPGQTRRQLEGALADFVPQSPTAPGVLGFLWNDFTVVAGEDQFAVDPARALVYGDAATRIILDQARGSGHRVRAIFRGHQHAATLNPLMRRLLASRGVFRHWQEGDSPGGLEAPVAALRATLETGETRAVPDGSVWTFNVSPDSVYGEGCGFDFDTVGELRTAERWEDWRLRVVNLPVAP